MDIVEQKSGAVLVVKPAGPLTGDSGAQLRDRVRMLAPGALGRLVLDFHDVPFLDSKGIEALLDAADAFSDLGLPLKLCHTPPTVREVLRVTGNSAPFEFFEDVQAGVRSFL